jgi:RIO-like serine/threonine protein kinase
VRFTAQQVVGIAAGIASALAYLHSLQICHGDVYAHNILLDAKTGHSTLCDFGGWVGVAEAAILGCTFSYLWSVQVGCNTVDLL